MTEDLRGGDDLQWRRPPPAGAPGSGPGSAPPGRYGDEEPRYTGPPPTTPPPPDWRPRMLLQPPPPRDLPSQNEDALDAEERQARTLTYGIGMVAGAVLLIVLLVLCGRVLF